jgi:hypothetical protein
VALAALLEAEVSVEVLEEVALEEVALEVAELLVAGNPFIHIVIARRFSDSTICFFSLNS